MKHRILSLTFGLFAISALGQKSSTQANYFDDPIIVDSTSTLIIPTRYNADLFSSNKIAIWGDVYANIIFYDFLKDTSKKLFDKDTYIIGFYDTDNFYGLNNKSKNSSFTQNHIFYRVKNTDFNKNEKIENNDPAILYVSDLHGNQLKALTSETENVVSIELFEKQNFALIKMQRDQDADKEFESSDKDYYYLKLDLTSFTFGNPIEMK